MYGNSPYNAIVLQLSCKTFFPQRFPTRIVALARHWQSHARRDRRSVCCLERVLTRAVLATLQTLDDNFPPIEYPSGRGQSLQPN